MRTAFLVLALALLASACSSDGTGAGRVDDRPVAEARFQSELAALYGNDAFRDALLDRQPDLAGDRAAFDAAFGPQVLTRLLYEAVIAEELDARGLTIDAADRTAGRAELVEELGRGPGDEPLDGEAILAAFPASHAAALLDAAARRVALRDDIAGPAPTDADVAAELAADPVHYTEVCASHVLLDTEADAEAVRDDARAGVPIADLARERSMDEVTRDIGGAMGCETPELYPRTVGEALLEQPVGEVGEPFESQLGWHVLVVEERRPPDPATDGPVALARLQDTWASAFEDWLVERAREADVEVDPAIGTWNAAVSPPAVEPLVADEG